MPMPRHSSNEAQISAYPVRVPTTEELQRQRQRAEELGAGLYDRADDVGEPLYALADPAGHPLCLLVSSE